MVTQEGSNVRVCAVRGNFDDCQRGVKEAFALVNSGRRRMKGRLFSSANSINIGRLVPQVTYYFSAYSQLMAHGRIRSGEMIDFVVPTGNLICASNANNVLTEFIRTGVYNKRRPFLKTSSPSMDILVSSNLERLLFYACEGDTAYVASLMKALNEEGRYMLSGKPLDSIQALFHADYCTEEETASTIARLWHDCRWLSDTHSAVGFSVLEKYRQSGDFSGNPCVVLSTASPFKFPSTVLEAIGGKAQADEFETADLLEFHPQPDDPGIHLDPVPVNPPVLNIGEIVGHQEAVCRVNQLPIREVGQEIGLVGGKDHSRSHWERISGLSV